MALDAEPLASPLLVGQYAPVHHELDTSDRRRGWLRNAGPVTPSSVVCRTSGCRRPRWPRRWGNTEVEFDGLIKFDLAAGTSTSYFYGPHALAGEAAFAPDPDRPGDEDGGWLVNLVHDRAEGSSAFVVVDAQGLEEVARVHLPRRVPSGFHGNWMASSW